MNIFCRERKILPPIATTGTTEQSCEFQSQAAAELTFRCDKLNDKLWESSKIAKFVKYRKQVGDSLQSCDMCTERSVAKGAQEQWLLRQQTKQKEENNELG